MGSRPALSGIDPVTTGFPIKNWNEDSRVQRDYKMPAPPSYKAMEGEDIVYAIRNNGRNVEFRRARKA